MSDITMFEAAKYSTEILDPLVAVEIAENSPILEYVPVKTIAGPAFRYDREQSLGGIAFRGVNGSWTPSAGTILPQYEGLVIMGGEVFVDNFQVATSNAPGRDLKKDSYRRKSRAVSIAYSEQFFEGDTDVDPYSFDGVRKKLPVTGSQVLSLTTGGAAFTLDDFDEALDLVAGDNSQKHVFLNKTMRREINRLRRAQTGSQQIITTADTFNRQIETYAGAMLHVIEREDDASTFLGFDEFDGTATSDTCSIYIFRFGMEWVHTIAHSGIPSVKDFGEIDSRPGHLGRIEWYVGGPVIRRPRAAARVRYINQPA